MPVLTLTLDCARYKYKSSLCSYGTLLVIITTIVVVSLPIVIIENSGGLWQNILTSVERPDVMFKNKYIMIAESKYNDEPIICSTMPNYLGNYVQDNCGITKVREIDSNQDGLNEVLKFELRFYSKFPIHSLRLYMFFNYELTKTTIIEMESMATIQQTIPVDVQKIFFFGDLTFHQKHPLLQRQGVHNTYNYTTDESERSLFHLLAENADHKFNALIENDKLTWQVGFSAEEESIVSLELYYSENIIYYRPQFWQELKWAWIQYFSFFCVLSYIGVYIINYIFINGHVQSYPISPWKQNK